MPWRRTQSYPKSRYWATAIAAILAVLFGVLIGYTRWGATASVVELVERQLTKTETRIEVLEKRLGAIEGKLGLAKTDEPNRATNQAEPQVSVNSGAIPGKKVAPVVPR